jgi:SAM-dependent methyltransferase
MDLLTASDADIRGLGRYDFVRLQHALACFSWEDGQTVLRHCARLLEAGGYFVVSVPDLRINIQKYLRDQHRRWKTFAWWAHQRIPKQAPASFYFSVFAHGVPPEPQQWCYDIEGLIYALQRVEAFEAIRELRLDDPLASTPFTHNRPEEDACVIATRR